MAVIQKNSNFMGLPINIARGNPIPLDKSEIWYSYEEMATYAKQNPVAYVGQILGLVDEKSNNAKAYIILNTEGDLQEVGSAVVVDNSSIALDKKGQVALKNWGIQYYKYVPKTDLAEAHYELQLVDESHPWKVGLEPKIAFEENSLILGWYEPNPTTLEGINSQITVIQGDIGNLQDALKNVYTQEQTDQKIAEAINNSDHYKRQIVQSIEEIETIYHNNENYIYMVPTSLEGDNKYYEYIVINGNLEKVGSWEVDLNGYATKEDLKSKVSVKEGYDLIATSDIQKLQTIEEGAQKNFIVSVNPDCLVVNPEGQLNISKVSVGQVENLSTLLGNKVDKEPGKGLSTNDLTDELKADIQSSSQKITLITPKVESLEKVLGMTTTEEGAIESTTLKVIQVDIETLKSSDKIQTEKIETANNNITILSGKVDTLQNSFDSLSDTYVSKIDFNATVGDIDKLLQKNVTLSDEVAEIQRNMQWHEI